MKKLFLLFAVLWFCSCEGNETNHILKEKNITSIQTDTTSVLEDENTFQMKIGGKSGMGVNVGDGIYINMDGSMGVDVGGGVILNTDGSMGIGF